MIPESFIEVHWAILEHILDIQRHLNFIYLILIQKIKTAEFEDLWSRIPDPEGSSTGDTELERSCMFVGNCSFFYMYL